MCTARLPTVHCQIIIVQLYLHLEFCLPTKGIIKIYAFEKKAEQTDTGRLTAENDLALDLVKIS